MSSSEGRLCWTDLSVMFLLTVFLTGAITKYYVTVSGPACCGEEFPTVVVLEMRELLAGQIVV